jgi:serine/threonine protein kinase
MSNENDIQQRLFVRKDYVINLDEKIGKGAFSKVYKARYNGQLVAAKLMITSKMTKGMINQLSRELKIIEILMEYPHPNILKYYKVEKLQNYIIILMELCEGGELKNKIERGLTEATVKNYVKQLVKVYLHILKLSIVHRDLKPTNILISNDGVLKLIDFGLSKVIANDMTATICGSPAYMAPEILYKQDYDSNADIWSLGILVYEMTYGFTPFSQSNTIESLKTNIIKSKIPFPQVNTMNEQVSEECKHLIRSLLSIDVDTRLNWMTISYHSWISEEFKEYNKEMSGSFGRIQIIDDLHKMLRGNLRHEPLPQEDNCANDDMIFSMENDKSVKISVNKRSDAIHNDSSGLCLMGSPVIDSYIDKELEDVNSNKYDKSVPIPIPTINKFTGGSRLDYVDFDGQDISRHVRVDRSDSITKYLYSRSAPIGIPRPKK